MRFQIQLGIDPSPADRMPPDASSKLNRYDYLFKEAKGPHLIDSIGRGGAIERPTPCAQGGCQRFVKCLVFNLLVSFKIRTAH
jgi:hypothetical protein